MLVMQSGLGFFKGCFMKYFFLIFFLFFYSCSLENANVIGPAGGFVFYDKGNYNDGWRYLEASPKDIGEVSWGAIDVTGTSEGIGSGRQNTDLIIAQLNSASLTRKAAQLCINYSLGGYQDWFLPSFDELAEMHKKLKVGFGGGASSTFKSNFYWSSTQTSAGTGVWGKNFKEKNEEDTGYKDSLELIKVDSYPVRAIRAF